MKRAALLPLVFLFGSIASLAQVASQYHPQKLDQSQPQTTVLRILPLMNTCPISLHARHAPGGDMIKVGGVPINVISQMLHLTVTNPDSRHVVAANVTVRGFANKGRLIQVMSDQDSYDAAKTVDVRFPSGSGKEADADLRVPGFSAVTVIDVNSVTYSDGSNWKLAAGSSCRSWIDGLMLVSSH
jgi:hypothetical protein